MPMDAETKARLAAERQAAREEVAKRRAAEANAAPPPSAPKPRTRSESQTALDQDIERVEASPRSRGAVAASKPKGADPGPDGIPGNPLTRNPDRKVLDCGFAQNDRVAHAKRGPGLVLGFSGDMVMVQFDSEPNGKHNYKHDKARRCLSFSDAPFSGQKPAPAAKSKASDSFGARPANRSARYEEEEEEEESSPSPIRAKPVSKPSKPVSLPSASTLNDEEREETDRCAGRPGAG